MKDTNSDLNYIKKMGLHDSIIRKIMIDYKNAEMNIIIVSSNKTKKYDIEFKKINRLKITKDDDLKNNEIILEFIINEDFNKIDILTTSLSKYVIEFEESNVREIKLSGTYRKF